MKLERYPIVVEDQAEEGQKKDKVSKTEVQADYSGANPIPVEHARALCCSVSLRLGQSLRGSTD